MCGERILDQRLLGVQLYTYLLSTYYVPGCVRCRETFMINTQNEKLVSEHVFLESKDLSALFSLEMCPAHTDPLCQYSQASF